MLQAGPIVFFFSSRRRHTRFDCDWSSDVCSSDLFASSEQLPTRVLLAADHACGAGMLVQKLPDGDAGDPEEIAAVWERSEEHTSELQSQSNLVCRLLLEKKKITSSPRQSP